MNTRHALPWAAVALLFAGCQSLGPKTVVRDRTHYGTAISDSWKEQTLLNIAKLRYADPPVFMDVGQIVSGYQFESSGALGGSFSNGLLSGDTLTTQVQGRYIDRPTITYVPLTGTRFINGLVTPISPAALFNAIQAGWAADVILYIGAHSINGLRNEQWDGSHTVPADPRFLRVTTLLRRLQLSGSLSVRVSDDTPGKPITLVAVTGRDLPPDQVVLIQELCELLQIDPNAKEFRLAFGPLSTGPREIAVQSRSLLNVLTSFGLHMEVPPEDVQEGRTFDGLVSANRTLREVRIHCSPDAPDDAFVAVPYRGHWFWIDDRDMVTKRAFSLIMMLFSMADTGGAGNLPTLTIPAG